MRCSGHEREGNVVSGCEEEATVLQPAHGILGDDGLDLMMALCDDHLAAAEQGIDMTITTRSRT